MADAAGVGLEAEADLVSQTDVTGRIYAGRYWTKQKCAHQVIPQSPLEPAFLPCSPSLLCLLRLAFLLWGFACTPPFVLVWLVACLACFVSCPSPAPPVSVCLVLALSVSFCLSWPCPFPFPCPGPARLGLPCPGLVCVVLLVLALSVSFSLSCPCPWYCDRFHGGTFVFLVVAWLSFPLSTCHVMYKVRTSYHTSFVMLSL